MVNKKFNLGDKVTYQLGAEPAVATVKGISTVEQAVLGIGYIVEDTVNFPTEHYPYTHFVVFAVNLTVV